MIKNHNLEQSIIDSVWSSFVIKLEYKPEWSGKIILMICKFELSSKICYVCGYYNSDLTLKDREWKCPDCKTKQIETLMLQLTSKNCLSLIKI